MRRACRAALLLALVFLVTTTGAAAEEPDETAPASTEVDALDAIASCVQERSHLIVELLVDESGSLARTDPDGARIVAARGVIATLADLGSTEVAGLQPVVEVHVAAFGASYEGVGSWTQLDAESQVDVDFVISGFVDRNDGVDTDFAEALLGAEDSLSTRAAQLAEEGVDPCRTVMLFTDGEYSIELRAEPQTKAYAPDLPLDVVGNPARVEAAGVTALCQTGGVMDRLRDSGVTMLTVALTNELDADDQAFIEALTTGSSEGSSCGTPSSTPRGAFLPAADLGQLLVAFDRVAGQISGGVVDDAGSIDICPVTACDAGTRSFDVDPTTRRLTVLVSSSHPDVVVLLQDPADAEPVGITRSGASQLTTASAIVDATWLSSQALSLTITPRVETPPEGRWSLTIVDPEGDAPSTAAADVTVTTYADLFPRLVGGLDRTDAGELIIVADVVDDGGERVDDPPLLTQMLVTVTDVATDETVSEPMVESSEGFRQALVDIPDEWGPEVRVVLTLDVTTDAGFELPTQREVTDHVLGALAFTDDAEPGGTDPRTDGDDEALPRQIGENTPDGSGGGMPLLTVGLFAVGALLVGLGIWWIRAVTTTKFRLAGVQASSVDLIIRPNGTIDRVGTDPVAFVLDPDDFQPLDAGTTGRSFSAFGLRIAVRLPYHPFDTTVGIASGAPFLCGSAGLIEKSHGVWGQVALELPGEWVFVLDETASLEANDRPQSSTYGEVHGRLVLFTDPDHFRNPPSELRRSLWGDLPAGARRLLVLARNRVRHADSDSEDTRMLDLVESITDADAD